MPHNYDIIRDTSGKIIRIETDLCGDNLLVNPRLNKGSAFSKEERKLFGLEGKLPFHVESLEEQVRRTYQQLRLQTDPLAKNIHLNNLHDYNETLFYRLVSDHLEELLPIIYTPTVGQAVEKFSLEMRRARGLYISYPEMDRIEEILANRRNQNVDIMVVTDGEGVLGIGDQGIGGMNISIAKLMVYVLCAGINPHRKLPITLDMGTNNQQLLNDPMYLGWRHERITGAEYDEFIDRFVAAVQKLLPSTFLHWEDFGRDNARRNLTRFREKKLSFNDDMQGTGAVALAAVLSGVKAAGRDLNEERIIFFGAGTAGCGIADQLCDAMVYNGLTREQAQAQFYLIDRPGLLVEDMKGLADFQAPYARKTDEIASWSFEGELPSLLDVVENVKPTILVGCSAVSGAFNETVIRTMAKHVKHPIIMPLSNPTSKAEAHPANILTWTEGRALIATGSPFEPVIFNDRTIRISQSNNAFVFPGIGLGVVAAKAHQLTDGMIWEAAKALSDFSPAINDPTAPLLPELSQVQAISRRIAKAIIAQAREEGVAGIPEDLDAEQAINERTWQPQYYPYQRYK